MASAVPRLHRAAARGEKAKLKHFLTAGDEVNSLDADGRTALLCSVYGDHADCVEMLLAAGADPSISENEKLFPLYVAALQGNLVIAKALIKGKAELDAVADPPDSGTALSMAVFQGNEAMVKLLLDAGCDTSKRAREGHHPLTIASMQGNARVVALLLDAGADVSAVGPDGTTALIAGVEGSCDVVKILLERGADVNIPNPDGCWTALHLAAEKGLDELIGVLVAAGADVNQTDTKKDTPLHSAAGFGHHKCAFALLRAGANVSAKSFHGSPPLHIAAFNGHTDVIEVLLSGGGHADVDLVDDRNRTPLILASGFADVKAVNLLLDAGANINHPDANGRTAIFTPSDVKVVKVLLDRGANVKEVNKHGSTVLHAAGYNGRNAGVICALFRAGADPTLKDKDGRTAANLARDKGHEDAAKLLDLLEAKHESTHST